MREEGKGCGEAGGRHGKEGGRGEDGAGREVRNMGTQLGAREGKGDANRDAVLFW